MELPFSKVKLVIIILLTSLSACLFSAIAVFAATTANVKGTVSINYFTPKTLIKGEEFNELLPYECRSITFDCYSDDYAYVVNQAKEKEETYVVDKDGTGLFDTYGNIAGGITMFIVEERDANNELIYDGGIPRCDVYVLSKAHILANEDCSYMFYKDVDRGFIYNFNFTNFDTSNVKFMNSMFQCVQGVSTLDLSGWDTSNVLDMDCMFNQCLDLQKLNISNFNTSKVGTDTGIYYISGEQYRGGMFRMFSETCLTELDLLHFDTSNVRDMGEMFAYLYNLEEIDLSRFDTSKVKNMCMMFYDCEALTTIYVGAGWNTRKVTDSEEMFLDCVSLVGQNGTECDGINNIDKTYARVDRDGTLGYLSSRATATLNINADTIKKISGATVVFDYYTETTYGKIYNDAIAADVVVVDVDEKGVEKGGISLINYNDATYILSKSQILAVGDYSFLFANKTGITSITFKNFDTSNVTNMNSMFYGCSSLTEITFSENFNTENTTNMFCMFNGCENLKSLDLSSFNTAMVKIMGSMFAGCSNLTDIKFGDNFKAANVGNMSYMFNGCESLTSLDLSGFNTQSATTMGAMFYGCLGLKEVKFGDNFNTSNVKYMNSMFNGCLKLGYNDGLDLSKFDTSLVENMSHMFEGCSDLTEIKFGDNFNTPNVKDMNSMFKGCSKLGYRIYGYEGLDLSIFGESAPTNMSYMFNGCSSLASLVLTNFDTSNVTNMVSMFDRCSKLNSLDLSTFDTSNVTNMGSMFSGCSNLTSLNISKFNTSNVTTMNHMFYNCSGLNSINFGDNFKTTNVNDMASMFDGCSSLTSLNLSNFDTSKVTTMDQMFSNCSSLKTLTFGNNFKTSNVTTLNSMFFNCSALENLDVSKFYTTKNVKKMSLMFYRCSSLTELNLSKFETLNVTTMSQMFAGCSDLESITFGDNFDTSSVTDMAYMFSDCSSLNELDLTSFNTSLVTNMTYMFSGCTKLKTIYVEDWIKNQLVAHSYMFSKCESLVGQLGTKCSSTSYSSTYARVDKGTSQPGYLSSKAQILKAGTEIKDLIDNNSTSVVFDFYDETTYGTTLSAGTTTAVDMAEKGVGNGGISLIKYNNATYILSNNKIVANADCSQMFNQKSSIKSITFNNFNTPIVENMANMFSVCIDLTSLDLTNFNTSNVTNMNSMFYNCSGLKDIDLTGFNTMNVTDMFAMFGSCTNLSKIYVGDGWNTNNVTSSAEMFTYCTKLVGGCGSSFDPSNTDKTYARVDGGVNAKGYLSKYATLVNGNEFNSIIYKIYHEIGSDSSSINFDYYTEATYGDILSKGTEYKVDINKSGVLKNGISLVDYESTIYVLSGGRIMANENCSGMFSFSFAEEIKFNNFDTRNVTNMQEMFNVCDNLTMLDLSSFDTRNVTNMSQMFDSCGYLKTLDLSSFDTRNVITMEGMFDNCSALTTIYAGDGWNTSKVPDSESLFYLCVSLVGGNKTKYKEGAEYDSPAYARIDKAGEPGYFTAKS